MSLPLSGRTVVERVGAGASEVALRAVALAGRIAADLGAEVVSMAPAGGCPLDRAPPFVAGRDGEPVSAVQAFLGAGKRVLPAGDAEACRRLLAAADALLADGEVPQAAGAPDAAPAVVVRVAHGLPAALAIPDRLVTDTAILAASGILDLVGDAGEAPIPLGGHQASGVAGLAAFAGLAAALTAVARGGGREIVTVSALEACLWSNWKSYAERLYLGSTPTRQGPDAEWHVLPAADGFATFVYLEKDWPAVARLVGEPRLGRPPLDTRAGRRAHMGEVLAVVAPWYAARPRAEIFRLAKAAGLPIAPVLGVPELAGDAQYRALGFLAAPAAPLAAAGARVPALPTMWDGRRFRAAEQRRSIGGGTTAHAEARPTVTAAPATAGRGGSASAGPDARRPLAGCRVLDLGIITAGASTSALLADLGADVIKVESPAYIDPFRAWDMALGAADWWNRSRFFDFTNRNKRGLAIDLKQAAGRDLLLDLAAHADVVVENFRRGVMERLGIGWEALAARNPRLVLCSVTSQGETGPDAGAASYGSTLEGTSGLADLTRDAAGSPRISGVLLNYPDQIVSIYAAGIVTLAVAAARRSGRGARLDVSQRELATFLVGEHVLAATAGTVAAPADARAPGSAITRRADARWQVVPGNGDGNGDFAVPVADAADMLAAARSGTVAMAFAATPAGGAVKGMPFALAGAPLAITRPAPMLGEHNGDILASVLGLDATAIARLAAAGVIGTRPREPGA